MKKLLLGLGSITAVVAPVAAVVSCGDDDTTKAQGQLDQILGDAGKISVPATINGTTVHANVMLKELPTNLSAETVELIVADIVKANLTGINLVTTIEVLATKTVITRAATVEMKTYTITVAAGKATDVNAVKTAAALTASAGQAPADNSGTTDGGNTGAGDNSGSTGTGTGSGSTDGGNAAATTTDLTASTTNSAGTVWHAVFRKSGVASLPEVNHVFTVTVNTETLTYTWQAADNTALAGFLTSPKTKTQDDVVNYLATKLVGTKTNVSADDVKAEFGITAPGQHSFTSTVTPAVSATGQATVVITKLDGTQTRAQLLEAIKNSDDFGTATNKATVTIDSKTLTITFTATDDATIATAITNALTSNTVFAGCFETPTV